MIRFGEDVCGNLDSALRREWLETNSIGGFASGTINGCNSRRYHGCLVAATKPPVGRFVLLSKCEEILIVNGRGYELGTNRYPGAVHPQGFQYLAGFRLDPFPTFTFSGTFQVRSPLYLKRSTSIARLLKVKLQITPNA